MGNDDKQHNEALPLTYTLARVLTAEEIAQVAGGEGSTSGVTGEGGGMPGPIIINEVDYRVDT